MAVTLWTAGQGPLGRTACNLPTGQKLPSDGNYIYHYEGTSRGWQLDLQKGIVGMAGNDALNSVAGTTNTFLATQYGSKVMQGETRLINSSQVGNAASEAKLQVINSDNNTITDMLSCANPAVHFSEATGNQQGIYFLADYPTGIIDLFVHDIFLAYKKSQ